MQRIRIRALVAVPLLALALVMMAAPVSATHSEDDSGPPDTAEPTSAEVSNVPFEGINNIGRTAAKNSKDIDDLERIAWSATGLAFVALLVAIMVYLSVRGDDDDGSESSSPKERATTSGSD